MLRVASLTALVAGLFSLAAYQSGAPKFLDQPFPANSTVANFFLDGERSAPENLVISAADSVRNLRILLLNYSAYDSAYASKMKSLIAQRFPGVVLTDFWAGTASSLTQLLDGQHLVVVTYPAKGDVKLVSAYGKVLTQFVKKGGSVVFSGTDQFGLLQQYGLFDLDFGYFCSDLEIHEDVTDHPILQGTPADFSLANYVYPLNVSDPDFVTLADIRGYPALGYKSLGAGKVVYLGLEYYYDEYISSRILENTLRWLAPEAVSGSTIASTNAENPDWTSRSVVRREETLYAGSGRIATNSPAFDLKIYPNPYFEKATLDVNLDKSNPVSVEMTDEKGVSIAVLLPYRVLNAGFYRLELPNVPSGVYFVKCQVGSQTTVRKVVKVTAQ